MVNLLPAVLIGGPPHAGKSVLLYNLTHALYERGIRHHAIRACPDGEGNWFQEGNVTTVSLIREHNKSTWSDEFIQRISTDVAHRSLPFLVDMGGHPTAAELPLFRLCTHAVLLLRADKPASTSLWQNMTTQADVLPLAQLYSVQNEATSTITALTPVLEGNITGLERQSQAVRNDPVFVALLTRIADLFNSYAPHDLEHAFMEQAPTELVLNLPVELQAFTKTSIWWQPEMLAPLLHRLSADTPLSVHGWGPNWLYAALAAHAGQQPFYQFDPKLPFGWIQPLRVCMSEETSSNITVEQHTAQDATTLSITFPKGRLEYFQPDPLPFPSIPLEQGLLLDGPLSYWLLTALVRLYSQSGVAWIGVHHAQQNTVPQQKTAIVVYSRVQTHTIGDLVPMLT